MQFDRGVVGGGGTGKEIKNYSLFFSKNKKEKKETPSIITN